MLALLLSLSSLPALAQEAPAAAGGSDAPAPPPVELVWTGALGGIGSGTYRFELQEQVPSDGVEVQGIEPVHGWLVQDDWMLRAEDHRVATLVTLLGGTPTCEPLEGGAVLTTPTEHLVAEAPPLPAWTRAIEGRRRPTRQWRCTHGEATGRLVRLDIEGVDKAARPDWDAAAWETRLGLVWTTQAGPVTIVGVPQDEGTRRIAALGRARRADRIFVDAGRFVDGASSVKEGSLSLHRPTGFAALRRLEPAALAPGATELIAGFDPFADEAGELPYIAANWRAEDPARALPPSRSLTVDGGRIAFVGVVDPALARRVPQLAEEGITLLDPVAALPEAVEAVRAGPDAADVVVVLGDLPPTLVQRIRAEVDGVDLVLGAPDRDLSGVDLLTAALHDPGGDEAAGRWTRPAPVTLPLDGVVEGDVNLDADGRPDALRVAPVPVTPAIPPDPEALAAVTRVRLQTYPELDHPLLPADPDQPTAPMRPEAFAKAVCEAVQDATRADLVLLPDLGAPTTPGSLDELLVVDQLALPDTLEVHRVPGDRFVKLLDQLVGMVPTTCGAPLAQRFPRARGRFLENERIYRVITTDRLRQGSAELTGLLETAHGLLGVLDPEPIQPVEGPSGEPTTLRGAALDSLRRLRAEHDGEVLEELLDRDATRWDPQWLVRVRQLSLRVEGFQGVDDDRYAQVPETLATSPSSFTLGNATDVALDYSDDGVMWDLRGRSTYTRLRTADVVQETADDLKLSSSVTLPRLSTPEVAGVSFRPFSEALYDSEFTAVETEDGTEVPLQRDLSLTLGVSTARRSVLRALRLGAFGLLDVSRPDKRPEIGGRAEVETRVDFGPRLRWTNQLDAFVYGSTVDDDASDLRFKARLDSRLQLPLAQWLDIALYGTGFAFQGRVPETSQLAASWSLGVSLDVGGVFEL